MKVWISVAVNAQSDTTDIEILDSEPTESFREGLEESFDEGLLSYWEIREGYVNGGDSVILFASNG